MIHAHTETPLRSANSGHPCAPRCECEGGWMTYSLATDLGWCGGASRRRICWRRPGRGLPPCSDGSQCHKRHACSIRRAHAACSLSSDTTSRRCATLRRGREIGGSSASQTQWRHAERTQLDSMSPSWTPTEAPASSVAMWSLFSNKI